jgi:hypothetical protein
VRVDEEIDRPVAPISSQPMRNQSLARFISERGSLERTSMSAFYSRKTELSRGKSISAAKKSIAGL